jgi:hypothetical protein
MFFDTCAAAFQFVLEACEAVIVQVPAELE